MKKALIISMLLMLGIVNITSGQEKNSSLDSTYAASETVTVAYDYNDRYQGSVYYDGTAGFVFTIENYVDTFNHVYFEGSFDGINFLFIDSLSVLTNGNYNLSQSPPAYLKYRLNATTATGDTATLKNIIYFEKKVKK